VTDVPIRVPIAKPLVGEEEATAVLEVLRSGQIAEGPRTRAFEAEFARMTGAKQALAVANGSVALHLALLGAGVGPGDEVIVPAFTFIATANMVLACGAKPVLVDVDPVTYNMDTEMALAAITARTKAIMPVHLFGLPAYVAALAPARERGIVIVGDAAQAHGAAANGRPVGSLADVEGFSLYPTKNMTSAEGGMVTTNDDAMAELMRSIRNHGRGLATLGTYDHVRMGYNYRLTDVHSAIGLEQLKKLETFNEKRRANAALLTKRLDGIRGITTPVEPAGMRHVWHQYTIRVAGGKRDALQKHLRAAGIGSGIYYPKPLHAYPHLAPYGHSDLHHAEALAKEVLALPVHPALTTADVEAVAEAIRAFAG